MIPRDDRLILKIIVAIDFRACLGHRVVDVVGSC